eukprot:7278220-Alexandrium_andersonii.AAC.1
MESGVFARSQMYARFAGPATVRHILPTVAQLAIKVARERVAPTTSAKLTGPLSQNSQGLPAKQT